MAALCAVLAAGADAVYLSGKRFGMRGHRSSFHFDDHSMAVAVEKTRAAGARIYVTVNNLLGDHEIVDSLEYVSALGALGVDAVIIQDLGLLRALSEKPPAMEIHASTMMNVHSAPFAAFLKSHGVSRIITSRDVSIAQAAEMGRRSGVPMEYFVHGDMCSVQSGLCHLSGIVFGQSANRGRCLKPCRWTWKIAGSGPGAKGKAGYFLARKDLCLFHALPEIVESGIASLKIEGRMRPADFLENVVGVYRRAIDRYYDDPFQYPEDRADADVLFKTRVRDFGSCHALGDRGAASMATGGRREPHEFSSAARLPSLAVDSIAPDRLTSKPPEVCAAIHDPALLEPVLAVEPDWVYLATDFALFDGAWTGRDIGRAVATCRGLGAKSAVILPPVTVDNEIDHLGRWVASIDPAPDGWIAGNVGQVRVVAEHSDALLMADSAFNIFNSAALRLLADEGVTRAALSAEISLDQFGLMDRPLPLEAEWVVHGDLQAMFTEDCLIRLGVDKNFDPGSCRHFCDKKTYVLESDAGDAYPIRPTVHCRNGVFFPRHICLLHRLGGLLECGVSSLRLNLFSHEPAAAARVVQIYRDALRRIYARDPGWFRKDDLAELERCSPAGLFEGGARYGVVPVDDLPNGCSASMVRPNTRRRDEPRRC